MGASLTMIDHRYGHLARDGREHTIRLRDGLNAEEYLSGSGMVVANRP